MKSLLIRALGAGFFVIFGAIMLGQLFVSVSHSVSFFDYILVPGMVLTTALGFKHVHDAGFWVMALCFDYLVYSSMFFVVFWLRARFRSFNSET